MKTVLVIDDDPQIISFLEVLLDEQGYRVLSSPNGKDALGLLETVIPDAIIVDAMMPNIDGYQFLWHLRSAPKTERIPTIMLTSRSRTQDIQYGKSLGANVYLTKPVGPQELTAALNYINLVAAENTRHAS
jgi:DNA-binding response OmpR family regulator